MRRTLSSERGMTLIEVLMASMIMFFVLSATLMLFDAAADNHQRVERHNDAQDGARGATDRMARELRNLASPKQLSCPPNVVPTPPACLAQPEAVDRAEPFDFIFRVVADARPAGSLNLANVKRVRYCLDSADPAAGRVHVQEQTWVTADPPDEPAGTACPAAGWASDRVVVEGVVNRLGATPRPLFVFDSTDVSRIAHVRTDVFVDPDPMHKPLETRLTSGVFLRNQNRVPVADFTATPDAGTHQVILNGSLSDDPESLPLEYWWYVDGGTESIGQGVVFAHPVGAGTHTYRLVVKDAAGLQAEMTRTVTAT